MPPYTVIGFSEEDGHIFVDHVDAVGPAEAIVIAVEKRENDSFDQLDRETYRDYFRNDTQIVSVLDGHCTDHNDCATVSSAIYWPGLKLSPTKKVVKKTTPTTKKKTRRKTP